MKDVIICDLDGTLALDEHRAEKYLRQEPKDWDSYFAACGEDEPNHPIIALLSSMEAGYTVWILSGRSEAVREQTEEWLDKYGIYYDHLVMRPVDDRTQDTELKIKWANERKLKERTLFVIEDRQRVVDSWRAAGYTCLQVAPGNF
jgi:alkanesulfonate monooxygenase SsuD/methylene tetrahydromethanopterin reductase-like flavin-dependent oxidoreductase (luciferase family)